MKSTERIESEPHLRWYWAVALLISIGVVVVGAIFSALLLYYGNGQSLPSEARTLVIATFTISAGVSFALWRWTLRRILMSGGAPHSSTGE